MLGYYLKENLLFLYSVALIQFCFGKDIIRLVCSISVPFEEKRLPMPTENHIIEAMDKVIGQKYYLFYISGVKTLCTFI